MKVNIDQDFQQKFGISISIIIELYKVLVSSLLILFVPQRCEDHICSFNENLIIGDSVYTCSLVINFITLATFAMMYFAEVKRENCLITYLDVNKSKPNDNESVGYMLEMLPVKKHESILLLNKIYIRLGTVAITIFIINTILSGIVVYKFYLDSQTTTTYVTNILFMTTKLADVYTIVTSEQNIFYSAYLKSKAQYNDFDSNKCIEDVGMTIENIKECEKILNLNVDTSFLNKKDETEETEEKIKVILHSDSENTLYNQSIEDNGDMKKTSSMKDLGYVI